MNEQNLKPDIYIVSFGPLTEPASGRPISASDVFAGLVEKRNVWFLPRFSKNIVKGTHLVFYQSGLGFRGKAAVVSQTKPTLDDLAQVFGIRYFVSKLELDDIVIFEEPIALGQHVQVFDFVANKTYWGHSVRSTPRQISKKDYKTLMTLAARN